MNPICFYHKSDLDGVCSAAIVKRFVPDCEFYGIDYGDEFPWDRVMPTVGKRNPAEVGGYPRKVYVVDFSLSPDDMERLAEASNLVWIDHHKTAIESCEGIKIRGIRDVSLAACELCWTWFDQHNGAVDNELLHECAVAFSNRRPKAVRLLGTYDSWRKDDPEWDSKVMPFQYATRAMKGAYDPASKNWAMLLETSYTGSVHEYDEAPWLDHAVERGQAILSFQKQQAAQIAKSGAFEHTLVVPGLRTEHALCTGIVPPMKYATETYAQPFRCLCLNTPVFNSQSFEAVYDPEKHDVMVPFAKMANGKWKVSLYSTKPEIDCGAIAKTFGGGGHHGAAGFVCDRLPWDLS